MKVDYVDLVRFLLEPLVENPEHLKLDQEMLRGGERVLVRIALEEVERGRVLGRGGRNIQALRHVLHAAGNLANQEIHVEFFGGHPLDEETKSAPTPKPHRGNTDRAPGTFPARRTRSRANYV